jgi:hypothetical protein
MDSDAPILTHHRLDNRRPPRDLPYEPYNQYAGGFFNAPGPNWQQVWSPPQPPPLAIGWVENGRSQCTNCRIDCRAICPNPNCRSIGERYLSFCPDCNSCGKNGCMNWRPRHYLYLYLSRLRQTVAIWLPSFYKYYLGDEMTNYYSLIFINTYQIVVV